MFHKRFFIGALCRTHAPFYAPPSYGRRHKAMLRSVLSVPLLFSVPFASWQYSRVVASNAFARRHHGMPSSKYH